MLQLRGTLCAKSFIVALAALAATASFAQSSVSISGLFDLGVNQIDFKGNKVTTTGAANGSATSTIIVSGTEDLGGGLKANFRWETNPDFGNTVGKTAGTPATGTTSNVTSSLGNGYSFVGVSGGFGEVQLGTLNFATLTANGDGNVGFGTAIGSGYRVVSFDAVRSQNAISYETPSFNGFSAKAIVSTKNDKQFGSPATGNAVNQQNGRDGQQELSLAYVNGPLKVRYARLETSQYASVYDGAGTAGTDYVRGTGAKFKLDTLSANYVYGALTGGLFYQKAASDVLAKTGTSGTATLPLQYDRKTTGVAVAYKVTPAITLMGNYAEVKVGTEQNTAAVNSTKTKVTGLGVDYALSKRTTAYVRYERDQDAAAVRAITGYTAVGGSTTYTAAAVGLRHTF